MTAPTSAKALLLALTRCDHLSPERQTHLNAIGFILANPFSKAQIINDNIRDFVHQDDLLNGYYKQAYDYLQGKGQIQEPAKNFFDFELPSDWNCPNAYLMQTFTARNSIAMARKVLQATKHPVVQGFWARIDSTVVSVMGFILIFNGLTPHSYIFFTFLALFLSLISIKKEQNQLQPTCQQMGNGVFTILICSLLVQVIYSVLTNPDVQNNKIALISACSGSLYLALKEVAKEFNAEKP